jgi:hypothetical protein
MASCFSGSDRELQRNNSKIQDDGRANVSFDEKLQAKILHKFHLEDKK